MTLSKPNVDILQYPAQEH